MEPLELEFFVRKAFGGVNRFEDPAGLANADIFRGAMAGRGLECAKAVLSYSIAIYNNQIGERCSGNLKDPEDLNFMEESLKKVISSSTYDEMVAAVEEYREFKNSHIS